MAMFQMLLFLKKVEKHWSTLSTKLSYAVCHEFLLGERSYVKLKTGFSAFFLKEKKKSVVSDIVIFRKSMPSRWTFAAHLYDAILRRYNG